MAAVERHNGSVAAPQVGDAAISGERFEMANIYRVRQWANASPKNVGNLRATNFILAICSRDGLHSPRAAAAAAKGASITSRQ